MDDCYCLSKDLLGGGHVETGVVGLHESLLNLAVLDQQGVALAAVVSEDGGAIEGDIERLGELAGGVAQEADTALAGGVERGGPRLHDERIIDRDNDDLTGFLEFGVVDISGDVGAGAGRAESCGNADNDALALQLAGEVDLVAGRVLNQNIKVGNGVALLDESRSSVVEQSPLGEDAGNTSGETAGSEHDDSD